MTATPPESWQRLQEVFKAALEREPAGRAAFVAEACGGDDELRASVERLLSAHDEAGDALESPVASPPATEGASHAGLEGMRLGAYEITGVLGEGGMGVVCRARQDQPRREVAIKLIRPGLATRRMLRRFRHEAEVLGRLHHPCIAQVYEAGTAPTTHGEQPFFAMELVDGVPLPDAFAGRGDDRTPRIAMLVEICEAVHHAHQKGVIHRDLKPANILVTADGRPKILDFGIARLTDADLETVSMATEAGQLLGTIPYMSPEQIAGARDDIDARSDVYALGVIAYELLTGHLPHDVRDRTIGEAARIIQEIDPAPLSSIDRTLRGDLETIVGKALERDGERRYASAAELAADLRRFLHHEPIAARPPSAGYQMRKFARRNRALVVGAAAVILVLLLGLSGTTWKAVAEARERRRAEAEVAKTRAINDILQAVLLSPDPFFGRGMDTTLGEAMEALTRRLDEGITGEPEVEADVRVALGSSYRHMGVFEPAELHLERAFELREELFGSGDPRTLECVLRLGQLWESRDRPDEAERHYRRAAEGMRAAAPEDDPLRLATVAAHARALRKLGRVEESAALMERAVAIQRRKAGPDAPTTLQYELWLARSRALQGRGREAIELVERVREGWSRHHGAGHPMTLVAIESTAIIFADLGRHAEAEHLAREAFEAFRSTIGDEHHVTMRVRLELAGILADLGRAPEGERLVREGLDLARRELGPEHPNTRRAARGLAELLRRRGATDEADAVLAEHGAGAD